MIKQLNAAYSNPIPAAAAPKANTKTADTSFDQQLAGALKQYLTTAGLDPAKVQISIAPASNSGPGQTNAASTGTRQLLVTVTNGPAPAPASVKAPAASPIPPGAKPHITPSSVTGAPTMPRPTAATPVSTPAPTLASGSTISTQRPSVVIPPIAGPIAPKAPETEADRYWAMQPKAVQGLREIEDPTTRKLMAWNLATQGYTIDVPIMVWDWDPQYTMDLRKSYGYTWVPSALQDTVKIAPGLQMPGVTPYDPNNPPPGSIRVNTDFV